MRSHGQIGIDGVLVSGPFGLVQDWFVVELAIKFDLKAHTRSLGLFWFSSESIRDRLGSSLAQFVVIIQNTNNCFLDSGYTF